MKGIESKGYWDSKEQTLTLDEEIERMYAIYNGKALKRLEDWFLKVEKLTGEEIEQKDKNTLMRKVTIQEKDIANWFQTKYERETIPRILRRVVK
jgi:hypothetical protein